MQENLKKNKCYNVLKIFVSVAMVFVFCASLVLAICAPVFTSNGVASALDVALPSDGVVGENLLKHSDISKWDFNLSGSTRVDLFNDNSVYVGVGGSSTYTLVSNTLSSTIKSTGGQYANLRFRLYNGSNPLVGKYTFTCNALSVKGNFLMQVWGYASDNPSPIGSLHSNLKAGINSFTFDLPMGYKYFLFVVQTYDELTLDWVKVEYGDSFTGFVPDYQNQLNDLQNQFNQANQEKQELQDRIDSFEYNFLTTLSRENLYYYNQSSPDKSGTASYTFMPNYWDSNLSDADRNFACPIYGYSSQSANRPYLFGIQLPYEVPAGSTLRLSYTAFCVGVILGGVPFSELWRLGYTYAFYCGQYGYPTTDNIGQLSVVDSYKNANGNIFIKVNQPTNFIAFDVVSRSNYSNKLVGYFTVTDDDVFELVGSDSSAASWYLAFNTLSVYYQGDMLSSAVDSAHEQGYNTGYKDGKVAGYNQGYSEGVSSQGDYSFMGLLGAVFDAPIQAFKGLLNFEILGVNMTAFVSSLFALAIIVVIIKISLGGK